MHWRHKTKTARAGWTGFYTLAAGGLGGFYAAWPAFQDHVPLPVFAIVATLLGVLVAGAHLLKFGGDE